MDVLYIGLQNESLFRFGISPNKLMDYMMAERPVLCAIAAGNDPVGDANCGFTIEPENPTALADAARKMYSLPMDQRESMGRNGRVFVERNHLYPVFGTKLHRSDRKRQGARMSSHEEIATIRDRYKRRATLPTSRYSLFSPDALLSVQQRSCITVQLLFTKGIQTL